MPPYLAIIDLAQIQNRTLHHTTTCTASAFDNAPVRRRSNRRGRMGLLMFMVRFAKGLGGRTPNL